MVSFARVISDTDTNRVINSNTGEYLNVSPINVLYGAGDANFNADPNIQGIAYDNSVVGATSTSQFGIDVEQDVLVTVANNAGTLGTVGSLGSNFSGDVGFDISGASGIAYASFLNGTLGTSDLYTINLESGAASLVAGGVFGSNVRSLTVVGAAIPEPGSACLLLAGLAGLAGRRRRV